MWIVRNFQFYINGSNADKKLLYTLKPLNGKNSTRESLPQMPTLFNIHINMINQLEKHEHHFVYANDPGFIAKNNTFEAVEDALNKIIKGLREYYIYTYG